MKQELTMGWLDLVLFGLCLSPTSELLFRHAARQKKGKESGEGGPGQGTLREGRVDVLN